MTVWAVLAGGRGTRYGQPKMTATFGRETFLSHCLQIVSQCVAPGDTVLVSVAHDPAARETAVRISGTAGIAYPSGVEQGCVSDAIPNAGPAHAVGRIAAEAAQRETTAVIMAVDMLAVEPMHLVALRNRAAAVPDSVVVARHASDWHWTLAAFSHAVAAKIAMDATSVDSLQNLFKLNPLDSFPLTGDVLLDVNSPDLLPPSTTSKDTDH